MTHSFDRAYWQQHWQQASGARPGSAAGNPPSPYLAAETAGLAPGTALDAGCGAGAEAIWLATHGWRVTAADISADVLARAAARATASGLAASIRWVEADLTAWDPGLRFDLVTAHYAHSAMPQLAFYQRISDWVAPGGTLLIVGHLPTPPSTGHAHGHGHPAAATVTRADITAGLDAAAWKIVTAEEHQRPVPGPGGQPVLLHDVVVRATRQP
ncbi:class I SAM-dependent methyltransferase [Solwaraspora sp. WMMD1047]|uniref:class I SAM-dependent methyltransferase n=1 Tax=Solwaraspora sp. WMMD1047 TaxID=3016102 RepID=UPI0024164E6A|nr:class I SAM-dependent methyltransferase [Solwaraspora sp. WMMD1047]MDG4831077.1 class I SAM-dependent methyltransferase [Solwaraspora sp. WMMD1047]